MKKISAIISLLLFFQVGFTQNPCLPIGIHLVSQDMIDNFPINYPDCNEILGGVMIYGDLITNLEGLNVVTSIGKSLTIMECSQLTNLAGLENLSSVGLWFRIEGNWALTNLEALENLTSVGSVWILNNSVLTSLHGLENLTSSVLSIHINDNDALISLEGLENIPPSSITKLDITGNDILSECDVQSICDQLALTTMNDTIENNAPGCNSIEEVEEACDSQGIGNHNIRSLTIHPNPSDNGSISITLDNPKNLHLSCFNTYGQQVLQQKICSAETVITVSTWTPGIYLAVVHEDGKPVGRSKFVVR